MIAKVSKSELKGSIKMISSKSQAHRMLICAALAEGNSVLFCEGMNDDISATIDCLNGLGAKITAHCGRIDITPVKEIPEKAEICVNESGSTLRFLLPVICALGIEASIKMCGRLPERPMNELVNELTRNGAVIEKQGDMLFTHGKLKAGDYKIAGNVSSQYVSGLLFAMCAIDKPCSLEVTGEVQSASYIEMTVKAIESFGICLEREKWFFKSRGDKLKGKRETIEGDWSNAAFWLCAGAVSGEGITLDNLKNDSAQGDRKIVDILRRFGADIRENEEGVSVCPARLMGTEIDAKDIPDLIPVLSVMACFAQGDTIIKNAERLRIKESDRLAAIYELIGGAGADFEPTPDGLVIHGGRSLKASRCRSHNDHRMAMSAAVLGANCEGETIIEGAQCVKKSYPDFWDKFTELGGRLERSKQ